MAYVMWNLDDQWRATREEEQKVVGTRGFPGMRGMG